MRSMQEREEARAEKWVGEGWDRAVASERVRHHILVHVELPPAVLPCAFVLVRPSVPFPPASSVGSVPSCLCSASGPSVSSVQLCCPLSPVLVSCLFVWSLVSRSRACRCCCCCAVAIALLLLVEVARCCCALLLFCSSWLSCCCRCCCCCS